MSAAALSLAARFFVGYRASVGGTKAHSAFCYDKTGAGVGCGGAGARWIILCHAGNGGRGLLERLHITSLSGS
jgi:hypothetical protein